MSPYSIGLNHLSSNGPSAQHLYVSKTGLPPHSAFHHPSALLFSPRPVPFSPPLLQVPMCPRTHSRNGPCLAPLRSRCARDVHLRPVCTLPASTSHHLPPSVLQPPPQVNRTISPNSQINNTLPQIVRYTCGSPPAANVPENVLSPRSVSRTPTQVNRPLSSNSQSANALPQIVRYTCVKTPDGNANDFRGFRYK